MKKRVLCISDSLGLPRWGVDYGETWFAILRRDIINMDFVSFFRRNGTTDLLSSGGDYGDTLLFYKPNIVIIQLGICDCAPRYYRTTSLIYKILYRIPNVVSGKIWKIIKIFKKRNLNCTEVSIEVFRQNLINYIEQCRKIGVEKVIVIKIATPGEAMVLQNPLILKAIEFYNKVYDQLLDLYSSYLYIINPLSTGDNAFYVSDGYHPNAIGNSLIAESIKKELIDG